MNTRGEAVVCAGNDFGTMFSKKKERASRAAVENISVDDRIQWQKMVKVRVTHAVAMVAICTRQKRKAA